MGEQRDEYFIITLNRPEKGNSLDRESLLLLDDAIKAIDLECTKAVILKGEGKNFCTGADLDWMRAAKNISNEENNHEMLLLARCYWALYQLDLPLIALVQGQNFGSALGFMALADFVLSSEDATFALPEVNHGFIPGVVTPLIIEKIGRGQFLKLSLTAKSYSALELEKIGLITTVCKNDLLLFELERLQKLLISKCSDALRETKKSSKILSLLTLKKLEEMALISAKIRAL